MRVLGAIAVWAIFALLPGASSWAQSAAASFLGSSGRPLPGDKFWTVHPCEPGDRPELLFL